jgi:hypothetical protein
MAQSSVKGLQNIRAAAILTTGAVASSNTRALATLTQRLMLFVDFTIGSLTNVIITPQVSVDGTTWYDITDPGALTLTATGKKAVPLNIQGAKLFRCTAQGTGTVTSSSLQLDVAWQET